MIMLRSMFKFVAVAIATMAASVASAEVLLYEGFSSNDYTADSSINGKKSAVDSIGLDTSTGWSSGTGVYLALDNTLTFPSSWSTIDTIKDTQDLRCAIKNSATSTTARRNRAQQRMLTCEWPQDARDIYFRFVMNVPSAVLKTNYLAEHNFWLGGLGTTAITSPVSDGCTIAAGIYMGVRNKEGTFRLSSYVKDPVTEEITVNDLFTIDATKTLSCVCVAKIEIGNDGTDIVSFYAAPIDSWDDNFEWIASVPVSGLITSTTPLSYLQMIGQYCTYSNEVSFDEFIVTTDPNEAYYRTPSYEPRLRDDNISFNSGIYTISAELYNSDAELSYILNNGTTAVTNYIGSYTQDSIVTHSFAAPTDNKTHEVIIFAENDNNETAALSTGIIYGGELTITKTADASEFGLASGTVVVSRQNADPFPLEVYYTFEDGTAKVGENYKEPDGVVEIPSEETSAIISVVPVFDAADSSDTSLYAYITEGFYSVPSAGVEVAVLNFSTPEGYNYWIAASDSDGLASNPDNWSTGHTPLASEIVVWDGVITQKDMLWNPENNTLTDTVAEWRQINDAGTVSFYTTYPTRSTFSTFNVTGDVLIEAGSWTHPVSRSFVYGDACYASKCATGGVYRLDVTVGGNVTVGESAAIDVVGKGAYPGATRCVDGSTYGTHGGTHNGSWPTFGSVFKPNSIGGIGTQKGTDQYVKYAAGSGAIHLIVAGDFVLNGKIDASSYKGDYGAGGAGSIWLEIGGALTGSGNLIANGLSVSDNQGSGGGRIAIYADTIDSTILKSATAAYSRWGGAGAGTVYTQDSTCGDKAGVISIYAGRSNIGHTDQITSIVPQYMEGGDTLADFRNATVKISGGTRVWATNVTVHAVDVASNASKIDLRGCTLKTDKMILGGNKIPTGTYNISSTALAPDGTTVTMSDYFIDTTTDADGTVVVLGTSFMIIIR